MVIIVIIGLNIIT